MEIKIEIIIRPSNTCSCLQDSDEEITEELEYRIKNYLPETIGYEIDEVNIDIKR